MSSEELVLVDAGAADRDALRRFLVATWHSETVVAHEERMRPADLPGVVALRGGNVVGHASYRFAGDRCELVSIAAEPSGQGTGSRLMDEVVGRARAAGCRSVWLTTTNDNLDALRLYQRRGFRLVELRPGAMDRARDGLKPEIPAIGSHGIPMRDELDLELQLA